MGKFVLVYRGGGVPESEREQQEVMAAWGAWFDSLGSSVLDGGAPFGGSAAVGGDEPGDLTGYSILAADDLASASAMAERCPIVSGGGSVEVYETFDVT